MAWTALNTGLTGSALNVNYIVINPSTKGRPQINHELLIATDDGVYRKVSGVNQWAKFNLSDPSNDEFADNPAATIDELTFHWVAFDPRVLNTFYALGAKDSLNRLWIYRSVDAGLTWSSRGVVAT